jgi:hypothetical protein
VSLLSMSSGGKLGRVVVVFEDWAGLALVVFRVVRPSCGRAGRGSNHRAILAKAQATNTDAPDPELGETRR